MDWLISHHRKLEKGVELDGTTFMNRMTSMVFNHIAVFDLRLPIE
jgi:hypothetical protein